MNKTICDDSLFSSRNAVIPAFLCVIAADILRKRRIIKSIESKLGCPPIRFKVSDLQKSGIARIRDELSSLSLFSTGSFVILEDIQDLRATEMDAVLGLHQHVSKDSCLLLCGSGLPKSKKLKSFAEKHNALYQLADFSSPKERKGFHDWIRKEFKIHGVEKLNRSVEEILVQASGGDLDHCATMIEQLSLFADGESITASMVTQLFGITHESDIFNVIDAILSGNRGSAILMLQDLLRKNENAFQLLAVFSRTLSKILQLKILLMKRTPPIQAKKEIRIFNDRTFERYVRHAKTRSLAHLQSNFNAVLKADARLKNHSLGNDIVIYDLVDTLIQTR